MKNKLIIISSFFIAMSLSTGCTNQKNAPGESGSNITPPSSVDMNKTDGKTVTQTPILQNKTATPIQQGNVNNNTTSKVDPNPQKVTPSTPKSTTPVAPSNTTQPPTTSTGIQYSTTIEEDILKYTNIERQKAGLQPLTINSTAFKFARSKSEEMIRLNYFDHKSPVNRYIYDIAAKNNWKYSYLGENIYTMNSSTNRVIDQVDGQSIVNSWMNSPGHRANILSKDFTQIGIGVAYLNGKLMATQTFYTP